MIDARLRMLTCRDPLVTQGDGLQLLVGVRLRRGLRSLRASRGIACPLRSHGGHRRDPAGTGAVPLAALWLRHRYLVS